MKVCHFLLILVLLLSSSAVATAQISKNPQPSPFKKGQKINVALFIFDQVEALDLNGPVDILAKANFWGDTYNIYTVALTKEPVLSGGNVKMLPAYSLSDAPQADILIMPGGSDKQIVALCAQHPELVSWIKKQHAASKITMSVCTGAFFLASAGVLSGKTATTHFMSLDLLRKYPGVDVVNNLRYVQDGKLLTTAGITSGMNGTLHLVELINGKEIADKIAQVIIYDRNADMSFMPTTLPY